MKTSKPPTCAASQAGPKANAASPPLHAARRDRGRSPGRLQGDRFDTAVGRAARRRRSRTVAFVDAAAPAKFACVVLDMRMPLLSGFEVQQRLTRRGIDTPVVFVSGHGDIPMALAAVRVGAVTFLEKPWRDQVLIDAVNEAVALNSQRRSARSVHDALRTRLAGLTRREREVAIEVADGRNAAEIGERIGLAGGPSRCTASERCVASACTRRPN